MMQDRKNIKKMNSTRFGQFLHPSSGI